MSRSDMVTLDKALNMQDRDDSWRRFQVDYPQARLGNFAIELFTIGRLDAQRLNTLRNEGLSRDPGHGTFRKLVETVPGAGDEGGPKRRLWMSDSRAEIMEHTPVFNRLFLDPLTMHKRVLVNGLGLGLVVHGALTFPGVDHVDVVEKNEEVIDLVAPFLDPDRVTVHHGDAYTIKWPPGRRWDLVWHDIWPSIDDDNLPGMDILMARYKNRSAWQGCWQRAGCLSMAKSMRQMRAGTLPAEKAWELLGGKADWLL